MLRIVYHKMRSEVFILFLGFFLLYWALIHLQPNHFFEIYVIQFVQQCLHFTFLNEIHFYFSDRIEQFIDENKALMRRMYGDFEMVTEYGPPREYGPPKNKRKRETNFYFFNSTMPPGVPDMIGPPDIISNDDTSGSGASYFEEYRNKRQTNPNDFRSTNQRSTNGPTKPTIALNPSMEPNTGRLVQLFIVARHTECDRLMWRIFGFLFFHTELMHVNRKLKLWHRIGHPILPEKFVL